MADATTISVLLRLRDEMTQKLNEAEKRFEKMGQTIMKNRKTIGIAMNAIGGAITGIGALSIKTASDVEEMDAKFRTVFGHMADETEDWARRTGEHVGRSSLKLMGYATSVQDIFVPAMRQSGLAEDEARAAAAKLSQQVTKLSVDLGSFNNMPTAEVVKRMTSAFVGNWESVRALGITINQTMVENALLEKGIIKTRQEMTLAQKTQEIYNIIMEQSADAADDAHRTYNSFANQAARLSDEMHDLGAEIGKAFLPLMTNLLLALTPTIEKISAWIQENPKLATQITLIVGGLGALMLILGPMVIVLPQLIAGFKGVALAIKAITIAMAGNPLGLLVTVITSLAVVLLPKLLNNWDTVWEGIKKITIGAINVIIDLVNGLTLPFRLAWQGILFIISKAMGALPDTVKAVIPGFKTLEASVNRAIDEVGKGIPKIKLAEKETDKLGATAKKTSRSLDTGSKAMSDFGNQAEQSGNQISSTSRNIEGSLAEVDTKVQETVDIWAQARKDYGEEWGQVKRDTTAGVHHVMTEHDKLALEWEELSDTVVKETGEIILAQWEAKQKAEEFERTKVRMLRESAEEWGAFITQHETDLFNEEQERLANSVKANMEAADEIIKAMEEELAARKELQGQEKTWQEERAATFEETEQRIQEAVKGTEVSFQMSQETFDRLVDERIRSMERQKEEIIKLRTFIDDPWFEETGKTQQQIQSGTEKAIADAEAAAQAAIDAAEKEKELDPLRQALKDTGTDAHAFNMMFNQVQKAAGFMQEEKIAAEAAGITGAAKTAPGSAAWQAAVDQLVGQQPAGTSLDASLRAMQGGIYKLPKFANGGMSQGGLALVGERGPELVSLPGGSRVHPNGSGPGGGMTFHFHGAVYGVDDLQRVVVEAVRDHAISGGFQGVFAEG